MIYGSLLLSVASCVAYYIGKHDAALVGLLLNVVMLTWLDYYNTKTINQLLK